MRFHRLRADLRAAVAISMGLASFLALGPAVAGDVKAGRAKADVCATCHGLDGLSKIAEAPNLAGQNEGYLIAQLNAFRSGARVNEMMSIVIKDLRIRTSRISPPTIPRSRSPSASLPASEKAA